MAILVTGCATQPGLKVPPKEPLVVSRPVLLDENCSSLARYARAVAIMRDMSVKLEDVDFVLLKRPDLPIGAIQREVYYSSDANPNESAAYIYKECVDIGYDSLVGRYNREQSVFESSEKERIKAVLDKKKPIPVKKTVKKVVKK